MISENRENRSFVSSRDYLIDKGNKGRGKKKKKKKRGIDFSEPRNFNSFNQFPIMPLLGLSAVVHGSIAPFADSPTSRIVSSIRSPKSQTFLLFTAHPSFLLLTSIPSLASTFPFRLLSLRNFSLFPRIIRRI